MTLKIKIVIGVMLLSLNILAQQPSLFTYTPTNSSGTFYGQAQVNSVAASANDWIAAFDASGVCAGASQIIVNSGVAYINLVIYGDDATTTTVDEGMSGSEDFTLKLYQASSGVFLDYPSASAINNFSNWVNTNGAPMPSYSNVADIYDFSNNSAVSFSLTLNLCEYEVPVALTGGSPSGGVYSGNGVVNGYFDPSITGAGNHTVTYTSNGNTASVIIIVYALANASLTTTGPFCENDGATALTSVTSGGVYSGSGVIAYTFNPNIVGVGSYWVTYTLTDTNGCMQDEETLLIVNISPNIPSISQSGNTLTCSEIGMSYQWYDLNMNLVNGANSQTYSPISAGGYYVEVSNGNCSEISSAFSFIISSINQIENSINLVVLNDIIRIETSKNIDNLKLLNINGQLLFQVMNANEISTQTLAKGLYFLIIENNKKIICRKVIL